MKDLQKKYLNISCVSPYSIPVTMNPNPQQPQISTPHLNQYQMQNYLLGGSLQLQNSSGNSHNEPKN